MNIPLSLAAVCSDKRGQHILVPNCHSGCFFFFFCINAGFWYQYRKAQKRWQWHLDVKSYHLSGSTLVGGSKLADTVRECHTNNTPVSFLLLVSPLYVFLADLAQLPSLASVCFPVCGFASVISDCRYVFLWAAIWWGFGSHAYVVGTKSKLIVPLGNIQAGRTT